MIRRYSSELSPKECKTFIRENLEPFSIQFNEEYMTGWAKLGMFSVSYKMGKWRLYNAVFNKAFGFIHKKKGETRITFIAFRGLSDPISLLSVFLGTVLLLSIVWTTEMTSHLDLGAIAAAAGCITAGVALITCLLSYINPDGGYAEREIIGFLERNLVHARIERK